MQIIDKLSYSMCVNITLLIRPTILQYSQMDQSVSLRRLPQPSLKRPSRT